MCSIMGYFGEVISMKDFHEGFAKVKKNKKYILFLILPKKSK